MTAEHRRCHLSRTVVVEASDQPDILIAQRARGDKCAELRIAAELPANAGAYRPNETLVSPIRMGDVHRVEAAAPTLRQTSRTARTFCGAVPTSSAASSTTITSAMPSLALTRGAALRPDIQVMRVSGSSARSGRDHRQRHDDVADRGKLHDKGGTGHDAVGRALSWRHDPYRRPCSFSLGASGKRF